MKFRQIFGWIMAALFGGAGLAIFLTLHICRFCAYTLWAIAAVIIVYLLLDLLGRHAKRSAKIMRLVFSTICGLLLVAATFTGVQITAAASSAPAQNCDYLIILGCAVNGDEPSQMLQYRLDAAYDYMIKNPNAQCVVSGGLGDGDQLTEAQCMYNELTAMGIEPNRIWLEEKATSTTENISNSLAILKEKNGSIPDNIAVLSSEFHLFRAGKIAADLGVDVQTVNAKTVRKELLLNYFIREILAVWKYEIFG